MKKILITGGCGFIGSTFLNKMVHQHPECDFLNLDALTYAGNPKNIYPATQGASNYNFVKANISNKEIVDAVVSVFNPDAVVSFAAESHVDRSILDPNIFIQTNVVGTYNLLEACKKIWKNTKGKKFVQISTDECFGEAPPGIYFDESSPYLPSTPYAASKAAADHLVKSYARTFGLPINITNCTNNYGPNQHNEKMIPRMISLYIHNKLLTVHGDGSLTRDWLYVEDNCEAIWEVLKDGKEGESYNISGNNDKISNLTLINRICEILYKETKIEYKDRIVFIPNRAGNDARYGIDCSYIKKTIGWEPSSNFEEKLTYTIKWYLQHHSRLQLKDEINE
jgi:dTDP-glucose 4,6-dehydratase